MRAVVQRVRDAAVTVEGVQIAKIGQGLVALVAISREDSRRDLEWMAKKIVELRIFDDSAGKLNLGLLETAGEMLVVSQFTLYGDCRKGRRPSYIEAATPAEAQKLYDEFVQIAAQLVPRIQSGKFQATMDVSLTNDGPVTLILDSARN